jgi:DNA-binding GntR family transcriptional regulator
MEAHEAPATSASRIHAFLSQSIMLGQVLSGKRLSPDELAEQFGTSATPVREALQKLTRDGLVINKPHSGFFVRSVSLKELHDTLEMREVLEVLAAGWAATRITESELRLLEQANQMGVVDDDAMIVQYVKQNRRFHLLIAAASGNDELVRMLREVHNKLTRFFVRVYSPSESAVRHERLIEALRSHDAAVARTATMEEMRATANIILDHVIEAGGEHWPADVNLDLNHGRAVRRHGLEQRDYRAATTYGRLDITQEEQEYGP